MSDLKSRSMAAKRTPLERSLRQKMLGQSQQSEPIRPQRMVQQAPLSFAQQRLWFLAQLEPRSPAYNILSATQIEGPLDTAALERSLTEMSRRHEALRTTFVVEDATPVQIIHPPSELKLQQFDFTTVSEEQREKEARRLIHEEAVCPFDLVTGPLLAPNCCGWNRRSICCS